MKTLKLALYAAAGLAALSATNSQAAIQAVPIALSVTVHQSTAVTNEGTGAITYTSSSSTLNSAGIVAEIADTLGLTAPAGAHLAVSIIYDGPNNVYVGDVVVADAAHQIIWDLDDPYSTENGQVYIYFGNTEYVHLDKSSRKSETKLFKGVSYLYAYFEKYVPAPPVELGAASVTPKGALLSQGNFVYFSAFDLATTGAFTRGNNSPYFTTGTINFAGAGEVELYDNETDEYSYFPFDVSGSGSAGPVASNNYPFYNNADD